MKRLRLLCAVTALVITATANISFAVPWVIKATNLQFQAGRWGGMSFTLNNKIYISGGYANMSYTADLQMYDPSTNKWVMKNTPPGPLNRSSGVAFVINGKAYMGLGAQDFLSISGTQKNLTDLWEYNETADSWTQKASLPDSGRTDLCVFVANNKAYIVGGNGKFSGSATSTNQVWEYDPAANKWTKKTDYPETSVVNAHAFAINGKGYVACGTSGTTKLKKTYEYNTTSNAWTPKADFIDSGRYGGVSFVVNNRGYIGLGSTGYTGYKNTFFFYDPVSDKWGYLPATWPVNGRLFGMAQVVDNKAYVGCGWRLDGSVQSYFRDWYEGDINTMLGIETTHNSKASQLQVYPNPSHGMISVSLPQHSETYQYTIYNLTGQRVATGILYADNKINISHLAAGQYTLEVLTSKETLHSIISLNE